MVKRSHCDALIATPFGQSNSRTPIEPDPIINSLEMEVCIATRGEIAINVATPGDPGTDDDVVPNYAVTERKLQFILRRRDQDGRERYPATLAAKAVNTVITTRRSILASSRRSTALWPHLTKAASVSSAQSDSRTLASIGARVSINDEQIRSPGPSIDGIEAGPDWKRSIVYQFSAR